MFRKSSIDVILMLILLGLFIVSVIAVYSGTGQYTDGQSFYFASRQLIWYIISLVIMIAVTQFEYDLLERLALYLYMSGIMMLVYVQFFGKYMNGSQRWIDLGFMDLQPSEFMKIFIVIYLAAIYKKNGAEKLSFMKSIPVVLKTLLITIIPFVFILKQPDLGSALLIAVSALGLLLLTNISSRMNMILLAVISVGTGFLLYLFKYHQEIVSLVFKPHQLGRIYSWINPSEYSMDYGYQLKQAILGIGAGQLTGSGFNQGFQVQSGRVPEAHTDFVFAVIGEEFGFIGASLLILLYFLLISRIITIGLRADNLFGTYICAGITILIAFQVFQNVGMTIGLMPVTGIALPFISYGGSALVTNMFAMGLVHSISARSKGYMFSSE
ncbi:rod shape-determining protein RodA [Gracilibacillus xinjiangensis]|uniref:Rod shape-determining protein RodA n=1 Tax=Gracilibacillus xinjiangensis TaxID=1193282 RepID=A0ABV8WY18_9BACI